MIEKIDNKIFKKLMVKLINCISLIIIPIVFKNKIKCESCRFNKNCQGGISWSLNLYQWEIIEVRNIFSNKQKFKSILNFSLEKKLWKL